MTPRESPDSIGAEHALDPAIMSPNRAVGGYKEQHMAKVTYEIVEHDGGWAYRVDGTLSETFPSHDAARRAAERAAGEQVVGGQTTTISYEDKQGRWHDEVSRGDDRPETEVKG